MRDVNETARQDRFYFKLFEGLDEPGCPICTIVIRDSRAYLDSVFYERITDVPTRMSLRDSFGLCNLHTWLLRDLPGSSAPDLGFAIIAKDLLSRFQRVAAEPGTQRRLSLGDWFTRARSRLRARLQRTPCPACVHAARSESVHLRQLLDLLGETAFAEKYSRSAGICLPHFLIADENHPDHALFPQLRERQIRNAGSLHDTLDRFVEKHDHRAKDEITPAEARAWTDAMEFLGGKRGVFDSEMRRPASLRLPKLYKR
ncbi:MAG: DUF6062 family protein [Deltaproteobacteria bacterium]|nr:DUF6062 family protein [Deltaproteobacteria bacterium]